MRGETVGNEAAQRERAAMRWWNLGCDGGSGEALRSIHGARSPRTTLFLFPRLTQSCHGWRPLWTVRSFHVTRPCSGAPRPARPGCLPVLGCSPPARPAWLRGGPGARCLLAGWLAPARLGRGGSYDGGQPAVSNKWTGWVCEITGWSWRLQANHRSSF